MLRPLRRPHRRKDLIVISGALFPRASYFVDGVCQSVRVNVNSDAAAPAAHVETAVWYLVAREEELSA
jgi:hypothetical protein